MKALTLFAVVLSGCSSLLSFDVQQSGQTTIQGGGLLGSLGFGSFSFNQSQDFQNNNTNKDHISECRLTKLTLKVVSGSDLGFLQSITFYVSAPNLPKQKIASKTAIGAVRTVDLDLENVDIAQYAKSDQFSITTDAAGSAPAQTTTIEADLTLNVHASIL